MLQFVENYLLPLKGSLYNEIIRRSSSDDSTLPYNRMETLMNEVVAVEHIRCVQALYKDNDDELGLGTDLYKLLNISKGESTVLNTKRSIMNEVLLSRSATGYTSNSSVGLSTLSNHSSSKLTSNDLLFIAAEGRARIVSLCKLCYGDNSIETFKAVVDLAAAYGQQGLWQQATEQISLATQKGAYIVEAQTFDTSYEMRYKMSFRSIHLCQKIFACLRIHASKRSGQLQTSLINEFMDVVKIYDSSNDNSIDRSSEYSKFHRSLVQFFDKYEDNSATWGCMINHLRRDCEITQQWLWDAETQLLPQIKSILLIPFKKCDTQNRGVVNSNSLAATLPVFPTVLKAISGTNLVKALHQFKSEISLSIDSLSGRVIDVKDMKRNNNKQTVQELSYELPITWEEYVCLYLTEVASDESYNPIDHIRAEVLTLLGVCQLFTNSDVSVAEATFQEALKQIELIGMESEASACDLYNSIAQMMVIKYKMIYNTSKAQRDRSITDWFTTDEGRHAIKQEMVALKDVNKANGKQASYSDLEAKAKKHLYHIKKDALQEQHTADSKQSLEAAYRYLVKSFEILENSCGASQPSVGGACLAIASVLNIMESYSDAREWLVQALRKMEKVTPSPERAIAFIQAQLSQVLSKQGHTDEAIKVLSKAAAFHYNKAKSSISRSTDTRSSIGTKVVPILVASAVLPGTQLHTDLKASISLNSRLIKMMMSSQLLLDAVELISANADLIEIAFGWDSPEYADSRLELGTLVSKMGNISLTVRYYEQSYESYEALYGKKDKRTAHAGKLLQAYALKEKQNYIEATTAEL